MTSVSTTASYLILHDTISKGPNCASSFFTYDYNWGDSVRAEVLAPTVCIYPKDEENFFVYQKSADTSEISVIIIIAVTFVMSILISIAFRSANPYVADWFRFIAIYATATLLFIFILQLGPTTPGFSRFVGFAVVIHNFAELYLLRMVWFGKNSNSFIGIAVVVIYVFLMVTFLAFLPMNGLYLLAMFQGASMDYLLCLTFPYVAFKFKMFRWNHCDFVLAAVASVIHVATIQPLFFGFAMANGQITGITTLGLFPTFFFYTYFAGRELGRLGFVGPSFQELLIFFWSSMMLKDVRQIDLKVEPKPIGTSSPGTDPDPALASSSTDKRLDAIETLNITPENIGELVDNRDPEYESDKGNRQRASAFSQFGVVGYFKVPRCESACFLLSAMALALLNALIVWFAPCYIKRSMLCKS